MNTSTNMDCLLLIDMQYGFVDIYHRRLISNVVKLTKWFINNNNRIIMMEYDLCGKTLSAITDNTTYYSNCYTIVKNFEDGSPKILQTFPDFTTLGLTFHVAGVNWTQCVYKTVQGLLTKTNAKIVAHKYASNPQFRKCDKIWDNLSDCYQNRLEIIKKRC